jgi:hypothetical protein
MQLRRILTCRNSSIRATLNAGDPHSIEAQSASISQTIFASIDLYTTANVDNMEKEDMRILILACRDQVLKHFKMLGVLEIKDAFEMFANDSLGIKIDFYGGKFKVPHLSKILNAYLAYRKKYIAKYENQVNLLDWRKPKPEEVIKQKNEETAEKIKHAYNSILSHFKDNGDIDYLEGEIKSHWGEILVKEGVINFTLDEKKEIVQECKDYVAKQIQNKFAVGEVEAVQKKGFKTILEAYRGNQANSDFRGMWEARYKKLIVIKSILNS